MKTRYIISLFAGLLVLLLSGCGSVSKDDQSHKISYNANGTVKENTQMDIHEKQKTFTLGLDGMVNLNINGNMFPGYGGGDCDEGYRAQGAYYSGGSYGGRGRIDPAYRQHRQQRRPYVQNTGDGRLHQRQEQPCYRDAYCDEYGTFHPAGYYYANGMFCSVH